jgi:hypothetical protein
VIGTLRVRLPIKQNYNKFLMFYEQL